MIDRVCPRCAYPEHPRNASFCLMCGSRLQLVNLSDNNMEKQ